MNAKACPRCESTHVAENVRVRTSGGLSEHELAVAVSRKPKAVVFDYDKLFQLHARVCGACGYTELYVERPEELYDIVRQAEEAR